MTSKVKRDTPVVVTEPIEGFSVPGLDPRSTEVSWVVYLVEGIRNGAMRSAGNALRHLASAVWSPDYRISLVSEIQLNSGGAPKASVLAVGVYGDGGDSRRNVGTLAADIERWLDELVVLRRAAPSALAPSLATHCFRICQGTRVIGGPGGAEVPVIWHGYPTPLVHLVSTAAVFRVEMRVRLTYLSTVPTAEDWNAVHELPQRIADLNVLHDRTHAEVVRATDRALASYRYLSNLLKGPLWVGEVAVASAEPLIWAQRQLLASAITPAPGVHWDEAGPRILDAGPIRGGFAIADLSTGDVATAHPLGLPVHGAFRRRSLTDLFSVVGLLWDVAPPPPGADDRLRDVDLVPPLADWRMRPR